MEGVLLKINHDKMRRFLGMSDELYSHFRGCQLSGDKTEEFRELKESGALDEELIEFIQLFRTTGIPLDN